MSAVEHRHHREPTVNVRKTRMTTPRLILTLASLVVVSCSGTVTMSQVERVVADLEFSRSAYDSTEARVLHLLGTLADGERMANREFLEVTLTTDEGATVAAPLSLCLTDDGAQQIACNEINVTLHANRTGDDLQPLLEELDAGFVPTEVVLGGGMFGTVHLFSGDVHDALDRARDFPAIRLAGYQAILISGVVGAPINEPRAFVPTTFALDPCDRCLVIQSGNTVTATYANPDGSFVSTSTLIR